MKTGKDNDVNSYYIWLVDKVRDKCHAPEEYSKVLTALFETRFLWRSDLDSNRAVDGLKLRKEYGELMEKEGHLLYLRGKCSMLEMMIALAIRCESEIMGSPYEPDNSPTWFWTMVEGLGLNLMTNNKYDDSKMTIILSRYLNGDERVRLFKTSTYDPTRSIWNQLNDYLMENFDFKSFLKK